MAEKTRTGGVPEWVQEMCAWRQIYMEGDNLIAATHIERVLRKMRDFDDIDMGDATIVAFLDDNDQLAELELMRRDNLAYLAAKQAAPAALEKETPQ